MMHHLRYAQVELFTSTTQKVLSSGSRCRLFVCGDTADAGPRLSVFPVARRRWCSWTAKADPAKSSLRVLLPIFGRYGFAGSGFGRW